MRMWHHATSNAMFVNLIVKYGDRAMEKIKVFNTRRNVKKEIISSINFGVKKLDRLDNEY